MLVCRDAYGAAGLGGAGEVWVVSDIQLHLGDCLEILPTLDRGSIAAVVTDPPWGNNTACNAQRFTRAKSPWWDNVDTSKITPHKQIENDDEEFDPRPFLEWKCILWGANWYTRHLEHSGGWLIWDKRKGVETMAQKGWPLGEAELAWTNVMGATRVFRNLWSGILRSSEKGEFYHPTQKPVELMVWCLDFIKDSGAILDPYMGSGTTGVACAKAGRDFIGIEIDPDYYDIAERRIKEASLQYRMF
jgi:site-specific DNA-methyltransferase (adenine-specific)/modification methylase